MIVVSLVGGLGNQMFQFAFGYAISKYRGVELKVDISKFDNYLLRKYQLGSYLLSVEFSSEEEIKKIKNESNIFYKIPFFSKNKKLCYQEKYYHYDKDVFGMTSRIFFEGYWQSEKYFSCYRKELIEMFQLRNPLGIYSFKYLNEIKISNSISVHIRRGDYISNEKANNLHGICTLDYYEKAINLMLEINLDARFFVFSDDLLWAKENLSFIENVIYIDDSLDTEEMYLMSQCDHNIIANSSFSWWGAWLNQNPNKIVIAPKCWFNDCSINTSDLIPASWVRL